jgi:hypothetical protein
LRYAIRRIAESSKATTKFDDATATKFLMHPLFSGCANWPRLEKGKDKKRAAGVLEDEEGGAPLAKRSNSRLLEGAMYPMGALAGDPRANAHYMKLHKEDVARRPRRPWC